MSATYEGVVRIGQVEFPIRLLSAIKEDETPLCLYCEAHESKLNQVYMCQKGDHLMERGETSRAYALPGDRLVPIAPDELQTLPKLAEKEIRILEVRNERDFPWRMVKHAYFVETLPPAGTSFNALASALLTNHCVAIGILTMRNHDHLVAFAPDGETSIDLLVLHWPYEMRPREKSNITVVNTDTQAQLQAALMKMFKNPSAPIAKDQFDRREKALKELVEAKLLVPLTAKRRVRVVGKQAVAVPSG